MKKTHKKITVTLLCTTWKCVKNGPIAVVAGGAGEEGVGQRTTPHQMKQLPFTCLIGPRSYCDFLCLTHFTVTSVQRLNWNRFLLELFQNVVGIRFGFLRLITLFGKEMSDNYGNLFSWTALFSIYVKGGNKQKNNIVRCNDRNETG